MSFNSVRISQENENWIVVVIENGVETRREFAVERHAVSCADGQRTRLGMPMMGHHIGGATLDNSGDALSQ